MDGVLLLYALVKTFYDQGKDYLDSFWPFILKALPQNDKNISLERLQGDIRERSGISIPIYSLVAILTRAKRKGFVDQNDKAVRLTTSGLNELKKLEPEHEVSRRINSLVEDARNYLKLNHGIELDAAHTLGLIQKFVIENSYLMGGLVTGEGLTAPQDCFDGNGPREWHFALLNYFKEIDRAKPDQFNTLRDIICGSIIATTMSLEKITDVNKRFEKTIIYLDTNIIFSILGMHFVEYNHPAQELIELMKREGTFEFRVFDFTIEEVISVLRNYPGVRHYYFPAVRVRTIHSSLKMNGWTPSKVLKFITSIDIELSKHNISVEKTNIKLKNVELNEEEIVKMHNYKYSRNKLSISHDWAAIDTIAKLRNGSIRNIEKCKRTFLTADRGLAKYNYCEFGHKELGTVAEVILDRIFTNILWLKNPVIISQIPLGLIVAVHSRELFIDNVVWIKFYETVSEMHKSNQTDERDMTIIFNDLQIQNELLNIDGSDVNKINKEWVFSKLVGARKRYDEDVKKGMVIVERKYEEKLSDVERKQTDAMLQMVLDTKNDLKAAAEKEARIWALLISALLMVGWVVLVMWQMPNILGVIPRLRKYSLIIDLLLIALTTLGFKIEKINIYKYIKRLLIKWINDDKIKNSGLAELERKLVKKLE